MPHCPGWRSGSTVCAPLARASPTKMRARRSARPRPATAAARRARSSPRRSSRCRQPPPSLTRWRWSSATSSAGSSTSRRFGTGARSTSAGSRARTRSPTGTRPMQVSPVARISDFARSLPPAWRLLGSEQRVAGGGSLLLIVSTFGSFTFVEAAEVLAALGVLLLLKKRADGSVFHLPFGDGTAIAAAAAWCGVLILIRIFDRPPGQSLLALACAALVFGAGMRERAKRPMDDLPPETVRVPRGGPPPAPNGKAADRARGSAGVTERDASDADLTPWISGDRDVTDRIRDDSDVTRRIPGDRDLTEQIPDDSDVTRRIPGDRDLTEQIPDERPNGPPDHGSPPEAPHRKRPRG